MDNNDVKVLIDSFKAYRDLLGPIQTSLSDFANTYDGMRTDIERLSAAFGGDVKENLQKIYDNLKAQAEKATDLSSRIDRFMVTADKYTTQVDKLSGAFSKVEEKLTAIDRIETMAEDQISRLDVLLEEKKKSYNVKELQRTLENYDTNVQKVSEFINKDVVEALNQNQSSLDSIKTKNDNLMKRLTADGATVEELAANFAETNVLLKKLTEKGDVNEAYLFDLLDKWAEDRKVKTKKNK